MQRYLVTVAIKLKSITKSSNVLTIENKLTNNPNYNRLNSWHFRLLRQQEKLMLFNQRYWGKYGKKESLANGDENSRFFFTRVLVLKKGKTMIINLKDESGVSST